METRVKLYLISGGVVVALAVGAALAGVEARFAGIGLMAAGMALFVVGTIGYVFDRDRQVRQRRRGEVASGNATQWTWLAVRPNSITEDASGPPTP